MHTSSFRFATPKVEPTVESRRPSEVRISYFDPRTGEPCATKPEPLGTKRAKPTNAEKDAARLKAQEEAARIADGMEQRKKKFNRRSNLRPVLVDDVPYESVRAAARKIRVTPEWLGTCLGKGKNTVKGHDVRFAEVA